MEKLFCDIYKMTASIPARGGHLPTDENGKLVFDSEDFCHTWEVDCRGGERPEEEPGLWEPLSFLPPVKMGCGPSDQAVHKV